MIFDDLKYDHFKYVNKMMELRNIVKCFAILLAGAYTHEWVLRSLRKLKRNTYNLHSKPIHVVQVHIFDNENFIELGPIWLDFSKDLGTADPKKVMLSFVKLMVRCPE